MIYLFTPNPETCTIPIPKGKKGNLHNLGRSFLQAHALHNQIRCYFFQLNAHFVLMGKPQHHTAGSRASSLSPSGKATAICCANCPTTHTIEKINQPTK